MVVRNRKRAKRRGTTTVTRLRQRGMARRRAASPPETQERKPEGVLFCCQNAAMHAVRALGLDTVLRDVEVVEVPCSGRVELRHLMKRLEDGRRVLVAACPLDNCKHVDGNRRVMKRIRRVRQALKEANLDENRARITFVSAVDSAKLARILAEVTRT